jgi:predicted regulator of Ras-like GTPase activity (Roadblock/LC7/MglB family)
MSKANKITAILRELEQNCEVNGSALVSTKGQLMAAALHQDVDAKAVSAMTAALLSIGTRVGTVLKTGETRSILVSGENSMIVLRRTKNAVLMALAPADAKLGLIDFEVDNAIEKIEGIL